MKTKLKQTNGITLIALIITIIILLILAMITIRILMNQGIIKHAKNATNSYKISEEKEKIALGYQNYKMDKIANPNAELTVDTATVDGSEADGGWTITFTETGNIYTLDTNGNIAQSIDETKDEIAKIKAGYNKYQQDKKDINKQIEAKQAEALSKVNQEDLDILIQYCIGSNDKDLLEDVLDENTMTFKDREPIENASTELTFTGIDAALVDGSYEYYIYFNYNGNGYKLTANFEYEEVDGKETYSFPTKMIEPAADTSELRNQLHNLEIVVEGATVNEYEETGWMIEFEESGNKYILNPDGTIEEAPGIKLDKQELNLTVYDSIYEVKHEDKETDTISVIIKGNLKENVTWTIEDDEIAQISSTSGKKITVTSKKAGTTNIKATCGEYIETCKITVINVGLQIGDYVGYDATKDANGNNVATPSYTSYTWGTVKGRNNGRVSGYTSDQTFDVNDYIDGWRVLGIEDGKLKLISAKSIGQYNLLGNGFPFAVDELNAICSIYGQGKGAVAESARSINIDDINSITGYNPEQPGDGKPYGDGNIWEYGNEVTYYWKGDLYPYYSGTNGVTGSLTRAHEYSRGFIWYDAEGCHNSRKSTTATNTAEGREIITKLTNNYYQYYVTTLTSSRSGEVKGISTADGVFGVIFRGSGYYLASQYVCCRTSSVNYGLRQVSNDCVQRNVYGIF